MTTTKLKAGAPARHGGGGQSSMLPELLDRILDRGLVVEGWVRVSLVALELLTVEARAEVMSIATYLRYADALLGCPGLAARPPSQPLPAPPLPQPTGVSAANGGQRPQQRSGQQTQAVFQPQRQWILPGQQGHQQQVQQPWERQGQPERPERPEQPVAPAAQTTPAEQALDDLQQQLVHAIQPILAAQLQILVHAIQSQMDPVFDMLCQRVRREMEAALEQSRTAIRQEIAEALEPVHATLRAELAQALKPVSVRLQQQVEQAFAGAPPSAHIS